MKRQHIYPLGVLADEGSFEDFEFTVKNLDDKRLRQVGDYIIRRLHGLITYDERLSYERKLALVSDLVEANLPEGAATVSEKINGLVGWLQG